MTVTAATIGFIIFTLATSITALISAVLYYHWVRYGVGVFGTLTIMVVYGLGTMLILLMLLGVVAQL